MRFRHFASAIALTTLVASAASAQTTFGPGAGGSIPDNNVVGLSSTISVPLGTGTISSFVDITLGSIAHTFVGDLIVQLSHGGVTVDLFNRLGSSTATGVGDSSNLGGSYTFADSGSNFLTAALGGGTSFVVPGSPPTYARSTHQFSGNANSTLFSAFVGLPADGDWTLTIQDRATGDIGSLGSWQFRANVTPPPPPVAPEPGSLALAAVGVVALTGVLRRRRA